MLIEYIKPLTTWLYLHPHWGMAFAFFIAFTETFAVIGAIIPGSVTLAAIGVLIGTGIIPAYATISSAIFGAVLGDSISFWLGHHYHERIRRMWPLKNYPQLLEHGERFFHAHGGKSIFIGRFIGPLRSILPIVSGMLNMPIRRFLFADIASGILWAPAYMLPGILLGIAALELPPETTAKLLGFLLLGLLFIWFATWLMHTCSYWFLSQIDKLLARFWYFLRQHKTLRFLTFALQDPKQHDGHGQLTLALLFIVSISLFIMITYNVVHQGILTSWNAPLFHLFQTLRRGYLDKSVIIITLFFDKKVMLTLLLCVTGWFIHRRNWRATLHWLANGVISLGSVFILKHLITSPRPVGFAVERLTYSFPSGHVVPSVAILGFLAILIAGRIEKDMRRFVYWPFIILIGIAMLSRLYLGAHWLTDVIGAAFLGIACFSATTLSYRRQPSKKIKLPGLAMVVLVSFIIAWPWFLMRHYKTEHYYSHRSQPIIHEFPINTWWNQTKPLLPLYRLDRLGKPIEILNVQWAASLPTITKELISQDWEPIEKIDIYDILNNIATHDKTQTLPILTPLYHKDKPVITFVKKVNKDKPIVILHLWQSHHAFKDDDTPLWIGNIEHRILWHHRWLEKHKELLKSLKPPLTILTPHLQQFTWRKVSYKIPTQIKHLDRNMKRVRVLLIKEKKV